MPGEKGAGPARSLRCDCQYSSPKINSRLKYNLQRSSYDVLGLAGCFGSSRYYQKCWIGAKVSLTGVTQIEAKKRTRRAVGAFVAQVCFGAHVPTLLSTKRGNVGQAAIMRHFPYHLGVSGMYVNLHNKASLVPAWSPRPCRTNSTPFSAILPVFVHERVVCTGTPLEVHRASLGVPPAQ